MATLPTILLILAALSVGAAVIAALVAFRSQREASSAIFPIVREEESSRARRARISIFVWIAVTALFLGGWLATLRLAGPEQAEPAIADAPAGAVVDVVTATPVPPTPTPTPPTEPTQDETLTANAEIEQLESAPATDTPAPPTATPSPLPPEPTATPTATATPEPTATGTVTSEPPTDTPEPTVTSTPVPPTGTPEPTVTSTPVPPTATPTVPGAAQVATAAPRTPAPPGVRVGPIQFATEITEDMEPVDPGTVFANGAEKIYAIFPFKGMSPGLDFKAIWYLNGAELARQEGEWVWGQQATSFTFLGPKGEGLYKLELYVNDSVVATKLFEIR